MANEHKTYELTVEPRTVIGKQSKQLRRQDLVPAVVYGPNIDAESIQVPIKELERVYLRAGNITLIDLKVGESKTARKVFIHNVQRNPVNHGLIHVDFLEVNLREEMTASVPINLIGEAPIVRRNEGLLLNALDHVQVRALPMDLPPHLDLDISSLEEIDQALHVSDLTIPENVTLLTSEEEMVVKITDLPVEEVEEVEEGDEEAAAEGAEGEDGATGDDSGGNAATSDEES